MENFQVLLGSVWVSTNSPKIYRLVVMEMVSLTIEINNLYLKIILWGTDTGGRVQFLRYNIEHVNSRQIAAFDASNLMC